MPFWASNVLGFTLKRRKSGNIQQNNGEVVGLVSVTNFSGEVVGSYNTLYEAAVNALDGSTIVLNDDIEMGFFELNGVRTQPTPSSVEVLCNFRHI